MPHFCLRVALSYGMRSDGLKVDMTLQLISIYLKLIKNGTAGLRWWSSHSTDQCRSSFVFHYHQTAFKTQTKQSQLEHQMTLGERRHKCHVQMAFNVRKFTLQCIIDWKQGLTWSIGSNLLHCERTGPYQKPLNLALHQAAKCGLVSLRQQQQNQQNAAFPYEPPNSTGYQENLTCNSYQL